MHINLHIFIMISQTYIYIYIYIYIHILLCGSTSTNPLVEPVTKFIDQVNTRVRFNNYASNSIK